MKTDKLLKDREPLIVAANSEHKRKPCPFCGWQTTFVDGGYYSAEGDWVDWWLIQCLNMECGIWASGSTVEDALKKWNRRDE